MTEMLLGQSSSAVGSVGETMLARDSVAAVVRLHKLAGDEANCRQVILRRAFGCDSPAAPQGASRWAR
jgi:hypothetical protein